MPSPTGKYTLGGPSSSVLVLLLCLLLFSVGAVACGKKAPPEPLDSGLAPTEVGV